MARLINLSQGETYICRAAKISLDVANQFCCASLKHGLATPFGLLPTAGQAGEKVAHLLLHRGTGAQARVGGRLLAHPTPDGLVGV